MRLARMGNTKNTSCFICEAANEDGKHLFKDCSYTIQCRTTIYCWLQLQPRQQNLLRLCMWANRNYKGSKLRKAVAISAFTATVYSIWKARNEAKWNGKVPRVETTINHVKYIVKSRINLWNNNKINDVDRMWLNNM